MHKFMHLQLCTCASMQTNHIEMSAPHSHDPRRVQYLVCCYQGLDPDTLKFQQDV